MSKQLHPLSRRLRTERLTGKTCLSEIVVTCSRRVIAQENDDLLVVTAYWLEAGDKP